MLELGYSEQACSCSCEKAHASECEPTCADQAMADVFDAEYVSLHVRVTNKGAFHLYTRTLGYECAPSRPWRSFALSWHGSQVGGQDHAPPMRCER